ncbi:MAG: hypothetical protein H6741_28680 [Alphaproteobacteria bacterium]|nr:hypothetical protein [Alphaproteobacteria bacterium]
MRRLLLLGLALSFATACAPQGSLALEPSVEEDGRSAVRADEETRADRDSAEADEEPACEDRCVAYAEGVYEDCLDAGGSEERCATRAREAYADCVDESCSSEEEAACEDRCAAYARSVNEDCLDAGGAEERCATRAREAYDDCVADNCG